MKLRTSYDACAASSPAVWCPCMRVCLRVVEGLRRGRCISAWATWMAARHRDDVPPLWTEHLVFCEMIDGASCESYPYNDV